MIDPLSMAVGAIVLGVGVLLGRLTKRRQVVAPTADVPTCPCGHTVALHDPADNRCRAEVRRPFYYDNGFPGGHEWVPCPCRRYLGPELPSEIYARYIGEVGDRSG